MNPSVSRIHIKWQGIIRIETELQLENQKYDILTNNCNQGDGV